MAYTLNSGQVTVSVKADVTITAGANSLGGSQAPTLSITKTFTNGTGAGKASKIAHAERTVTAAPETIDLSTTLLGPDGVAVDFTATGIKGFAIYNKATASGAKLTLGGAAANAWVGTAAPGDGPLVDPTDKIVVSPGECRVFFSPNEAGGFGVSGTSKNLKVDPGANTITYDLIVWG